jgi:hypothetical protein
VTGRDKGAYAFRGRSICTYIAVESPEKECGKSTLLTVLSHCVHRPVVSSNITSSAFFRLIAELDPTLLIDEADINLRGSDELRGILNAGYAKPNAFVWRVAYDFAPDSAPEAVPQPPAPIRRGQANPGRLARFTCWCPKVIASIGRVHDTLASRCIVIRLHRKTQAEACERLKFLDATALKRQCARFAADHADAIAAAEPVIPDGLANRGADVWEPLLAIADLAGGRWPELARKAALALTATARDRNPITSLLLDILDLFVAQGAERFFSRDLVTCLNDRPGRPWAELRKGRAVDETWLAKQLRPYGVQPVTIRIGELRAKGYTREALKPVFRRYVPQADFENNLKELCEAAAPAKNSKPAEGPAAALPTPPQTESGAGAVGP